MDAAALVVGVVPPVPNGEVPELPPPPPQAVNEAAINSNAIRFNILFSG